MGDKMSAKEVKQAGEHVLQSWFITMKMYDRYPARIPTLADAIAVIRHAENNGIETISPDYFDYCN